MSREQTILEHLAELRGRLIWTLVTFILLVMIAFLFVTDLFHYLASDATRMFPEIGEIKMTVLGPGEILKIYFLLAGAAALGLTLPVLLYHAYRFLAPAVDQEVRRHFLKFLPLVAGMFCVGILFGYFVVFPVMFKFLYTLGMEQFNVMFTAGNYLGFLTNVVLPFGFIFELPVAVAFMTALGIITPFMLARSRRYAYLICVIIASLISPPELVSHLMAAVPMILFFELSITVSRFVWKKRIAKLHREEEAQRELEEAEAAEQAAAGNDANLSD
ncbi:sec-independent protein translocase protein TatC [Tumebacillus sp. BK434]|uniref:twin-arginine translocase subunit TatC n=1 Tax=Tumebacillus sp. BK434 TaxID=2512169 RepID=UPI001045A948|nr:twin-arginine translocase subunit TatC [Tumebacillus sp. BK434]TCP52381.1 sec-independent protein translocase protein TatC [Tumebacillus sp. BK434]